jgi:hypothetical protein
MGSTSPPDAIDVLDRSTPAGALHALLLDTEIADFQQRRATAARMAGVLAVLEFAEARPEHFVDLVAEPTAEDRGWAVRAATADLAVRLAVAEGTIVAEAMRARTIARRAPRSWLVFADGGMSVGVMRALADVMESVPLIEGVDAALDVSATENASLAPARFRAVMRRLREDLHPESLEDRRRAAADGRRFGLDPADDGMAWLSLLTTAPVAVAIDARVDAIARSLAGAGEPRTLEQLRADVAADLLRSDADGIFSVNVSVGLTVPVLTLLGHTAEPAILEGYGPIDVATARELAAGAPSFHRILTHPVTGTILDVDRTTYRVPADLKRWVRLRDQHCTFPGCGRGADRCDLDHTVAWAHGGGTAAGNLGLLCEKHHRLKHNTAWRVERPPGADRSVWRSPTGSVSTSDPPPF